MVALNLILASVILAFSAMAIRGFIAGDAAGPFGLFMVLATVFVTALAQIISRQKQGKGEVESRGNLRELGAVPPAKRAG